VPAILDDKPPLAVAVVGSLAVALIAIPLAHGGGPKTLSALLGTALSLLLTGGLAVLFTELTHLTGLSSEEAAFLQLGQADLSLEGLLLAGMVVGALGVLDDVTISQASTVLALRRANPSFRFRELFGRALEVGRDHVSATVDTLVLAYVGAALPILLLFSATDVGAADAVKFEIVAKEIVATLVGSIGLIAAVPITTALAAALALGRRRSGSPGEAHQTLRGRAPRCHTPAWNVHAVHGERYGRGRRGLRDACVHRRPSPQLADSPSAAASHDRASDRRAARLRHARQRHRPGIRAAAGGKGAGGRSALTVGRILAVAPPLRRRHQCAENGSHYAAAPCA